MRVWVVAVGTGIEYVYSLVRSLAYAAISFFSSGLDWRVGETMQHTIKEMTRGRGKDLEYALEIAF